MRQQMEGKHVAAVLIAIGILSFAWIITDTVLRHQAEQTKEVQQGDCWPIPNDQSTGTIRCWSGGVLVYGTLIYHNGGVLCSTDGAEIDIVGKSSICVIESKQGNVWIPPGR